MLALRERLRASVGGKQLFESAAELLGVCVTNGFS